jgi:NDP-sugar pyrophosphorylase family protein
MKIIIPMAGKGKAFNDAGYTFPKPLIDINDKPMIQIVVENLNLIGDYIFLVQKEQHDKFSMKELLNLFQPNCKIITIDHNTQGAAKTVLLAKDLINNDEELIIANADQWVNWNPQHFLSFLRSKNADGGIVTFISTHPRWSFVKIGEDNLVTEVAEKKPISNIATAGIYYFKKGRYFVEGVEEMIRKNIHINNEFYIVPSFNEIIKQHSKIYSYPVAEMKGLGTPEELNQFINSNHHITKATES